ncbi:ketoacyl-synt-domain-containing protein [Laetiporus sulphureus 93-53]|uniref:Ketoacyl-synt-domain-containing protein n=1 Tax=Laetiporus sulphureus 93-53 TaxID=1314785 RepID=A0A165EUR5_9APHY|nr:ketoacyl-synt-domain-containing protein [Laetiporus sulphureus 93-53]KZT07803.1 ketoacyl-synt-domain-containing protein [Laetiporus sulphureus 93-53]
MEWASDHVFVFDGQGTLASFSPHATNTALRDAKHPTGHVALSACHAAFLQELQFLPPACQSSTAGVDSEDFQTPDALLNISARYRSNAIIANTNLFLMQILRFLANSQAGVLSKMETQPHVGCVLGFSSGLFAACVVASSADLPSLLCNIVEAFRLAFWVGYHSQRTAASMIGGTPGYRIGSPWSLILFGSSRPEVSEAVKQYSQENPNTPKVYLTAAINTSCITVSGQPDVLEVFKKGYLPSTTHTSQFTHVHTLYHAPELGAVKDAVMLSVAQRKIRFPSYEDLCFPMRSTVDGATIDTTHHSLDRSLVEDVLNMILLEPVNFDYVVRALRSDMSSSQQDTRPHLVNLGPGSGLWRSVARALNDLDPITFDWTAEAESTVPSANVPRTVAPQRPHQEPIAIVGMAANFPGASETSTLWEVLKKGLNTVQEIPGSRFNVEDFANDLERSGRILKTRYGNFIESADVFDHEFFRVSPREATSMDPQQRVLLHVAYHALENAGYVPHATPTFDPKTFATYVGVSTNDYVENLRDDIDVYYSTGTLRAFLSGKISYAFGFSGPSIVIDTACSSSAVAIYQACRALVNGDCNAAIAGGVNVMTSPDMYVGLDRAHFLSSTGQCRPWDASADGYCRAEGCGMFVLKRLTDAIDENDRILGVIRGVEVNQSGLAESITNPHTPTQVRLYEKLLDATGIHPHQISVIEAHGTGTQAGDPVELESLRRVFAVNRASDNPLHVTSIKANIGHGEAASGAASLAKLILMMRERTIPATISLQELNPRIADLARDNIVIDKDCTQWDPPGDQRRLALLNNFGASGSNCALILEEPPINNRPFATIGKIGTLVLGISCESEKSLERLRALYLDHLAQHTEDWTAIADTACTATVHRRLYRYRIAVAGGSQNEVMENLQCAKISRIPKTSANVIFLFSGQGEQYPGMGSGIYEKISSFRRTVDLCNEKLLSWGFPGVLDIISPQSPNFAARHQADDIVSWQCAIFILEYALATMWISWGLRPDAVAGYSLGEYAALVCSGVLSVDDALWIVAQRAVLMGMKCTPRATGMLVVHASLAIVSQLLNSDRCFDGLSIACDNSATSCVVAGNTDSLQNFQRRCLQQGYKCVRLEVPYGYHSSAMDPIVDDLRALGARVTRSPPIIPVLSGVHGVIVQPGDTSIFTTDYFARHCREPVLFRHGISKLVPAGRYIDEQNTIWIEIGPHPTLQHLINVGVDGVVLRLFTLRKHQADENVLCSALTKLYTSSSVISWRKVYADLAPTAKVADVPFYPFAETRFWVPYRENAAVISSIYPRSSSPLCGTCIERPSVDNGGQSIFEFKIDEIAHLLQGHRIAGHALCPASLFHEMVLFATHTLLEMLGEHHPDILLELSEVDYDKPLLYAPRSRNAVRVTLNPIHSAAWFYASFTISSCLGASILCHCRGSIRTNTASSVASELSSIMESIGMRDLHKANGCSETMLFYASTIYKRFACVVTYADVYQTIKSIAIDPDGTYADALIQCSPLSAGPEAYPIFMDTLFQVAGFLLNGDADEKDAFICSHTDRVTVIPELIHPSAMYSVFCSVKCISSSSAIADVYAVQLEGSEGSVVARLQGVRFKRLKADKLGQFLNISTKRFTGSQLPGGLDRFNGRNDYPHNYSHSTQKLADRLIQVVAHSCCTNTEAVHLETRLQDLGIDSLMAIELVNNINEEIPFASMETRMMAQCERVIDLVRNVEDKCRPCGFVASFPYAVDENVSSARSRISPEQARRVISSVLGIASQNLLDSQELGYLGMDSLSSIETRHAIQSIFGEQLPEEIFSSCNTVGDLVSVVTGYEGECNPCAELDRDLILLQDFRPAVGIDPLPLILVHDGSGTVLPYAGLTSLSRPVWGIRNPKLSTGEQWDGGIIEMAHAYAEMITAIAGDSGCIVGGWSFGGVVAFEVARQLVAAGINVAGIVLIDAPSPRTRSPLPDSIIDATIGTVITNETSADLLRSQLRQATRALVNYEPSSSPASHVCPPPIVMLHSTEAYPAATVDSEAVAFLAERSDRAKFVREWEEDLGATIPVLDIPGNHFEAFSSRNIAATSERLRDALAMLDP